ASFAQAGFLIRSSRSCSSATAMRSKRPNAAETRSSPAAISSSSPPSARASAAAPTPLSTLESLPSRSSIRPVPSGAQRRNPAPLGDELELAVPAELAAEEVAEANRSRPQAPQELRHGALVHLEQPEIGIPGAQQRGRDSRDEIRARAVVCEPVPRTEDLG